MMNPKTLAQMINDPRVESFSDERGSGSGLWFDLKDGFMCSLTETHTVTEDSIAECVDSFRFVKTCRCVECEQAITNANHKRAYFQGYPPRKEGI